MFGDVPDPAVMTVRVGFGITFGRVRGEVRGLTREVRLGLADCEERVGLREEGRDAARQGFRRPKTSDEKTGYYCRYIYPLGHQTISECDET